MSYGLGTHTSTCVDKLSPCLRSGGAGPLRIALIDRLQLNSIAQDVNLLQYLHSSSSSSSSSAHSQYDPESKLLDNATQPHALLVDSDAG